MTDTVLNRRTFLQSATAAGALVVFASMTKVARAAAGNAAGFMGDIGPFVRINADNSIIIGAHVPDMGQGTFTSLPMIIAEELDVPFEAVRVEQMPLLLAKSPRGVSSYLGAGQSTAGGSNSVKVGFKPLRQAGAKARLMLLEAAAENWDVPIEELATDKGKVLHSKTKRQATYGQLATAAAKRPVPDKDVPLKSLKDFKVIGKPHRHRNVDKIITGEPLYGIDAEMPGMLHGVIARSPYLDGTVASLDDSAAKAVPGVKAIVQLDRPPAAFPFFSVFPPFANLAAGVAVLADSLWAAMKGREALKITWARGPGAAASEDSAAVYAETWKRLEKEEGALVRNDGDFAKAKESAARIVEARYEAPLAAHACMEPLNALVSIAPDGASAIAILNTQAPDLSVEVIAQVGGVDPLKVQIELARMGGGFGRKFQQDMVYEAAFLSKAVGKPVKLVWTREDDIQHDLYRPGACHLMQATLDSAGKLTGWRHKLASHSMVFRYGDAPPPLLARWRSIQGPDFAKDGKVPPLLTEYYWDGFPSAHLGNFRVDYLLMPSAAPRGPWRSPAHVVNGFAIESFLDEIAQAMGKDPVQLRLDMIGIGKEINFREAFDKTRFNTARLGGVLKLAAEKSGWGTPLPKGRGRGIAVHFTFGTYLAEVVEVTVQEGKLSVDRVVAAVDCGQVINPNGVRAQTEGAINDGLSAALGQAITIKDGQVEQSNFDTYDMMRIAQSVRRIDVHIVESDAPPTGMGEPGIAPLAPALANAIFAATGKRIRKMPMLPELEKIA